MPLPAVDSETPKTAGREKRQRWKTQDKNRRTEKLPAAFLHFIHRVVRYNIRPRLSLNELTACPATSLRLRRFACDLGLGNSGASSFDVVYSVIFCRDSLFITVFSTMNDLRFRFSKAAETLGWEAVGLPLGAG